MPPDQAHSWRISAYTNLKCFSSRLKLKSSSGGRWLSFKKQQQQPRRYDFSFRVSLSQVFIKLKQKGRGLSQKSNRVEFCGQLRVKKAVLSVKGKWKKSTEKALFLAPPQRILDHREHSLDQTETLTNQRRQGGPRNWKARVTTLMPYFGRRRNREATVGRDSCQSWRREIGVVALFVLFQILWSIFLASLPPRIPRRVVVAAMDVLVIVLANLNKIPESMIKAMGGVLGWAAMLLLMWLPVALKDTNYLNPFNSKDLSVLLLASGQEWTSLVQLGLHKLGGVFNFPCLGAA